MNNLLNKIPSVKIDSYNLINSFAEIDSYNLGKHPTKKLPAGMSARNIPDNDIWIAATAYSLNAALISTDKHFEHLNGSFIDFVYIDQSLKENDDFELSPFVDEGGLGKMWKLFGEKTEELIEELNKELVV